MAPWRERRSPRHHRQLISGIVFALSLSLTLAACGGSPQTNAPTPVATLPLPTQLAAYHIYVSDLLTGNVAVLGLQTTHVSRSVHGLALSADKKSLYVTDIEGGKLDVFALVNGRLGTEHSVAVGEQPVHMVGSLDGRTIYVANFASGTVSVVDTQTWKQTKTITVPGHPFAMALSPDGREAYVACGAGPAVAVIDTASNTLAATITTPQGTQPYGLNISADGRYVYTTDNANAQLLVIDTTTRSLVSTLPIGAKPALIARSPDNKTLYVSDGADSSISVIDIANDPAHPTVRATIPVIGYPHGIDVSPDGKYLVVADTTGNAISIIDAVSLTMLTTINGEEDPNDVLVTG